MASTSGLGIQINGPQSILLLHIGRRIVEPGVGVQRLNRRVFDDRDVAWINSLNCLKNCNMGIAEMKEYLALCLQGEGSIPERKVILEVKRKALEEECKRIEDAIAYIDWKQGFYDDVLSGKTKYFSNLIPAED